MAKIIGTNHNDTLDGTENADTILGKAGVDTLNGNGGNDTLDGGTGNDSMFGGSGNDTFLFSDFSDHIHGGDGFDTISFAQTNHGITLTNTSWNFAQGEVDTVEAITGSKFADHIDQTGPSPLQDITVHGGAGADFITSNGPIFGDAGDDHLAPQGQNLFGAHNVDVYGGSGHDTFEIDYVDALNKFTGENAVIHDFQPGTDHLEFVGGHDATVNNVNDVWTIHDNVDGTDTSFTLEGITHLDPSSDYTFG